jgi:hypothetical protein
VKDVDEDNSAATLFFVDWGNTDNCSLNNIRTLEQELFDTPVLKSPFSLHMARPIENTNHWGIDDDCFEEFELKEGTLKLRPPNKDDSFKWPIDICCLDLSRVKLTIFYKIVFLIF